MEMHRQRFESHELDLSYLDAAGSGVPVIALHAHWMEGATFRPLAAQLAPAWRVIAPDQRGHGFSAHATRYRRDDYIADLLALLDHLALDRAILLGNSLGGANAYQFAARHPDRVTALVIEDIGVEIDDDVSVALAWRGLFETRAELETVIGPRLLPAVAQSLRETAAGWRMAFDPDDMVASQAALNGSYWDDWLASPCPALVMRGKNSPLSDADHLRAMAARRPHTRFVELDGGHAVHVDNPDGFVETVQAFLTSLDEGL